jgi:hypothetical protein
MPHIATRSNIIVIMADDLDGIDQTEALRDDSSGWYGDA